MAVLHGVETGRTWTWTRTRTRTRTRTTQDLQDGCFFQITPILEADEGQQLALPQGQRDGKDKERLFWQETNRRRRMVEERRQQWKMEEKRRHENILQQRREKIQHDTERFQRCFKPPPPPYTQRPRPTIQALGGKSVNLDDVTKQIPGLNASHHQLLEITRASFFVPIDHATVPESHHGPTPPAVESDTDVLWVQKQNKTEPEPDHSPQFQDIHQFSSRESERLYSGDSLASEDDVSDTDEDQQVLSSLLKDLYSQNQPTLDLAPYAWSTPVGGELLKKPTKLQNKVKTTWRLISTPAVSPHNYDLLEDIAEHFVMHARSPEVSSHKRAEEEPSTDINCGKTLLQAQRISPNNSWTKNVVKEEADHEKPCPSSGSGQTNSGQVRFPPEIQSEKQSGHLDVVRIRNSVDLTYAKFKRKGGSKAVGACRMTDIGVQVNLAQEETDAVTVLQGSNTSSDHEAPWKEHGAGAGAGPVITTAQKGTLVPTKSVAELSRIAKSIGRSMIPRLPHRMNGLTVFNPKAPHDSRDQVSVYQQGMSRYYSPFMAQKQTLKSRIR